MAQIDDQHTSAVPPPAATSLPTALQAAKPARFLFVDGLRGFAAMAVVFYHLVYNTELAGPIVSVLPRFVQAIAFHGSLGVKVFFVISGFVIAWSLRLTPMTPAEIGKFAIRRQLRLDPPYWVVLAIVLLQSLAGRLIPSPVERALPTPGEIALNATYLYKLCHSRELLGVAWTLCIEIQYYLTFVALLLFASFGNRDRRPNLIAAVCLALTTGVASAFIRPNFVWFGPYWHYFTAGALCVWALHFRSSFALVALAIQSVATLAIVSIRAHEARHDDGEVIASVITGLITVWTIYALGRADLLTRVLRQSPFQYFGRISYSLYLVHLPVLMVVMQVGQKITGQRAGFAIMWMLLAWLASIVAADIFYRVIERPSMRFASRFKRQRPPPAPSSESDLAAASVSAIS